MARVFSDLKTSAYGASGHPEAPFRVSRSFERLKAAGLQPEKPVVKATKEDVLLLHSQAHYESVMSGTFSDPDTPNYPGIGEIALISLSGALSAAESAKEGVPAFSLMRPPGHHAGKERVSGFCFFNNLPLACARLLTLGPAKRVAIVDVDVHHGDGTQELVLGNEDILFVSLHQVPLYPGTGTKSEKNCLNFPLPPGTSEAPYLKTLEKALEAVILFKPDVLAVSAGFDTYKEDPLAEIKLDKGSYKRIGKLFAQAGLRRFATLEGGYAEDMPVLIENFVTGFFS